MWRRKFKVRSSTVRARPCWLAPGSGRGPETSRGQRPDPELRGGCRGSRQRAGGVRSRGGPCIMRSRPGPAPSVGLTRLRALGQEPRWFLAGQPASSRAGHPGLTRDGPPASRGSVPGALHPNSNPPPTLPDSQSKKQIGGTNGFGGSSGVALKPEALLNRDLR